MQGYTCTVESREVPSHPLAPGWAWCQVHMHMKYKRILWKTKTWDFHTLASPHTDSHKDSMKMMKGLLSQGIWIQPLFNHWLSNFQGVTTRKISLVMKKLFVFLSRNINRCILREKQTIQIYFKQVTKESLMESRLAILSRILIFFIMGDMQINRNMWIQMLFWQRF